MDELTPLFSITAAAELAGMHPQTLRQYDRLGLVSPTRTAGRTRRYSMKDVVKLREVQRLSSEGLNLEGIKRIVELEEQVDTLTKRVRDLESTLADEILVRTGRRVFAAGAEGRRYSAARRRASEKIQSSGAVEPPSRHTSTFPPT
jgi:MerR family transcriptional regulator/heat shock protein HspR